MTTDAELARAAEQVATRLFEKHQKLVTAESCTAGWIGKVLTDIPGSSRWYLGGTIVYSNVMKQSQLGVTTETLMAHGAVSEAAAREMASGALTKLGGDVAVSVTGIAGPTGAQPGKPVGTVWFAWAVRRRDTVTVTTALETFAGDREAVRRATVARALAGLVVADG
jgi:nicotinamide-nucleotide amidase